MPAHSIHVRPYERAPDGSSGMLSYSNMTDFTWHQFPIGSPCLSVIMRGQPQWIPLSEVSGSKWVENRDRVAQEVEAIRPTPQKNNPFSSIKMKCELEETKKMVQELYGKLGPEDKKGFLQGYPGSWLTKRSCKVCLSIESEEKFLCIHSDCPGMCWDCRDTMSATADAKCPACSREQALCCPICKDPKTPDEMVKSDTCSHRVCWKCYGMAFKTGNAITRCPLCRASFTEEKEQPASDDMDDQLDELMAEEEIFPRGFFDMVSVALSQELPQVEPRVVALRRR